MSTLALGFVLIWETMIATIWKQHCTVQLLVPRLGRQATKPGNISDWNDTPDVGHFMTFACLCMAMAVSYKIQLSCQRCKGS